jgi:sulfonate transport system permease protein
MTKVWDWADSFRAHSVYFLSPLLLLIIWAWVCSAGIFPEQILVSPVGVFETSRELWDSGELSVHLQDSLLRLGWGFAIGALLGLLFGVLMGLFKSMDNFFAPSFNAIRQVPTIAFIPMLIMIFGVEETFKIVVVAKAAFFPITLATYDAVKGIPRTYFEVSRVYQLPAWHLITRIVLPATTPPILTGFRLALGRSWMVLVAAELIAADSGIGQMMEMGRQMFRIDIVLVGVLVTGLIGFLLDRVLRSVEAHLGKWKYR